MGYYCEMHLLYAILNFSLIQGNKLNRYHTPESVLETGSTIMKTCNYCPQVIYNFWKEE